MRWIANFVRRVAVSFRDVVRSGLAGAIAVVFTVLAGILGTPERIQRAWFGPSGPAAFDLGASLLAIALLGLAMIFFGRVARRMRAGPDLPGVPASNYTCRVLTSHGDARYINDVLVKQVFPDGSVDRAEALRAQQKNNQRLIGLIDNDIGKIVGWAALWPVTEEAGKAIESGELLDDQLTAAHVLPRALNGEAKYLILLAFAIHTDYRNARENPTVRLGRYVLTHICRVFLRSFDRSIRLVAVAYTPQGEKLCGYLKLEGTGASANYGPGREPKPIYAGDVTIDDLNNLLSG